MTDTEKVTAYIEKHQKWSPQLQQLRAIFTQTELLEEIKWGAPCYSYNKKLVAGMAAFKNHYAIWFHQGVFLSDPAAKLNNAQEGKTKALTPGKQKDYANYIGEAKREATQRSRMEKIIPMILEGKGLWDKYKNC